MVYRAHNPRWAFKPESGDGAALYGGRFNPIGTPALYTSRRFETAWLEAQQSFAFKAQPMTICAYEVDCEDMIDLTDAGVRATIKIEFSDLACAWEDMLDRKVMPPSWALAERLRGEGAAGIIVPSFASGALEADINIIFWHWAQSLPHQVTVIDHAHRLPVSLSI